MGRHLILPLSIFLVAGEAIEKKRVEETMRQRITVMKGNYTKPRGDAGLNVCPNTTLSIPWPNPRNLWKLHRRTQL